MVQWHGRSEKLIRLSPDTFLWVWENHLQIPIVLCWNFWNIAFILRKTNGKRATVNVMSKSVLLLCIQRQRWIHKMSTTTLKQAHIFVFWKFSLAVSHCTRIWAYRDLNCVGSNPRICVLPSGQEHLPNSSPPKHASNQLRDFKVTLFIKIWPLD